MNKIQVTISCCDHCPHESNIYELMTGDTRYYCDKNRDDEWNFSGRDIPDHCPLLKDSMEKKCGNCKHFVRFAMSDTDGFCQEYNKSTLDYFRGCGDWEEKK